MSIVRWTVPCIAVVAILLNYAILAPIVQRNLGLALGVRVIIAVLCIAPLALLMGVPFPSGLRILKNNEQVRFIPWAWGINGAASVLGSVASIVLAMGIGFLALTLLAALIYVLGMCALLTVRSPVTADVADSG